MRLWWLVLVCGMASAAPMIVTSGGNAVMFDRRVSAVGTGTVLECSACRGEFESMSAVVAAGQDLHGLTVTVAGAEGLDVDVRIVKSWYQGQMVDLLRNHPVEASQVKVLTPELLLKDDALVRVSTALQANFLRDSRPGGQGAYLDCSRADSANLANVRPLDTKTLQPVDMAAGTTREFWINVHVPQGAKAGRYKGEVRFSSTAGTVNLPLRVTVYPFDLAPSRLTYSLYYRGRLSEAGAVPIESDLKTEQQYRTEIADMRDHGVLYPANYQGMTATGDLERTLRIRQQVGLPVGDFFTLACGAGDEQGIPKWLNLLKRYGYRNVYFYGSDEAEGDALLAQKAAWQKTQDLGGKTFVATYSRSKAYETMGSLLNLAIISGLPNRTNADAWHAVGSKCFAYLCPQVGVEDPVVYRRNFGLLLWRSGYDGAMDYAYQHAFHSIWNDFDDPDYRDHCFTYPTVNGVVGTVQWEGFREAVDDVRYVTTLEQAIAGTSNRIRGRQAQAWLDAVDVATGDMDETRTGIITWIMKLR
jgi:hypothetical protein